MSLLDNFQVSTQRPLNCGCPADRGICVCGVAQMHGGVPVGEENMHRTICKDCKK